MGTYENELSSNSNDQVAGQSIPRYLKIRQC